MPVTSQTYIDIPFAASGSVTQVPDAVQGDGSVSFSQGYGANYTLAQGSPGSLNVEEVKMNYLFNLITTVLQKYQQQTIAPWIPTAANNGTPYPYSQYSLVMYTNGIAYISLVNSNTVLPGSDSTKWQPITLGTGLVAANNLSDVVSASTSRTNLGLGSAALLASSAVLQSANNLSDLGTLATALTNLGFAGGYASGYQKLPGGLIIQWGIGNGSASGPLSVSFPTTFPTAALSAVLAASNPAAYIAQTDGVPTASGMSVSVWSAASPSNRSIAAFFYVAIGY